MNHAFGRGAVNSEKAWDCYIHINNFGFHEKIKVSRSKGRLDYQLIFIMNGSGYFTVDGKELLLSRGDAVLYRPGEPQIYREKSDCLCYWIHFSGTEIPSLLERMNIKERVFKIENTDCIRIVFKKMFDAAAIETPSTEDVLNSLFISLLADIRKTFKSADENMVKVISEMKSQGFKGKTSEEYAKIAGLSEYHFIRKFKKLTGMTPSSFKAKQITEKAIILMESTDMNISEIADSLGFEDALYFSRFFKKHAGVSPKKFKEIY